MANIIDACQQLSADMYPADRDYGQVGLMTGEIESLGLPRSKPVNISQYIFYDVRFFTVASWWWCRGSGVVNAVVLRWSSDKIRIMVLI